MKQTNEKIISESLDRYLTITESHLNNHFDKIAEAVAYLKYLDNKDGGDRMVAASTDRGFHIGYDNDQAVEQILQTFSTEIRAIKFKAKDIKIAFNPNARKKHIQKEIAKKKRLIMSKFMNDLHDESIISDLTIHSKGIDHDLLNDTKKESEWFRSEHKHIFSLTFEDTNGRYSLMTSNPYATYLWSKPSLRSSYDTTNKVGVKNGKTGQFINQ